MMKTMEKVMENGSGYEDGDDLKEQKRERINGHGMEFNFGSIGGDIDSVIERVEGNKKVFEFKEFGQREPLDIGDLQSDDSGDDVDDEKTKMSEEEERKEAMTERDAETTETRKESK